ncbi:hypothetical protein AKUG0102_12720 [Apilactobacillus kunkeei]|nr:hypothetical protein AKUG0102_12720 [Apilactobacillus kunkeei]
MEFSNNERKLHFKMYKSGKQWITVGIMAGAVAIALTGINNGVSAKAEVTKSVQQGSGSVTQLGSNADVKSGSNSNLSTSGQVASTVVSSGANVSIGSGSTVVSSAKPSSAVSYNATKSTVDSSSVTVAGANQQNSKAPSTSVESSTNNKTIASNASDEFKSHTKVIDGKTYYFNNNAELKSQVVVDNSTVYYFGTDGALTDVNTNFASGTIAASDKTAIYSADDKNITNVNGFITADSWYRPKQIQLNDNEWRNSTSNDFRPLLSVWWPSQKVEINYLNYMSQQGLVSGSFSSSNTSDQLNAAAATIRLNIEKIFKQITAALIRLKLFLLTS